MLLGLSACTGNYFVSKSSIDKLINWQTESASISYINTYPLARFTHEGKSYEVTLHSVPNRSRLGTVFFPPDDPTKAELNTHKNLLFLPLVLGFIGLLLIVIGFFSMQNRITGKKIPSPSSEPQQRVSSFEEYLEIKKKQIKDHKDLNK